jgi:hypothetical protein
MRNISLRRKFAATTLALLAGAMACGGDGGGLSTPNEPPPDSPSPGPEPLGKAIYAVDLANRLMLFGTGSLGTLSRIMAITGLPIGKRIVGIDFRPSNGKLYGVGNDSRVYVLDTLSGTATPVGNGPFSPKIDFFEVHFGVGFDPKTERIRLIVAESGANYSINPDDGTATLEPNVHYAVGDVHEGVKPAISGLGYVPLKQGPSARMAALASSGQDLVEGVLLAMDSDLGTLVESLDPKTGEFVTLGDFGIAVARCAELKVGVNPDGTANIIVVALTALGNLAMKIDVLTGKATSLGVVGDKDSPVQGIAFSAKPFPTNLSISADMRAISADMRAVAAAPSAGTLGPAPSCGS